MKIALISDMHGETRGLRLALEDIQREGCDVIYCLGDMIHGGGEDEDVVRLIRENRIATVFGNHELKHQNLLDADVIRFIDALPERICFDDTVISHASPLDRKKITCIDDALHVFENVTFGRGFVGHTHFPFVYSFSPEGELVEHEKPYNNELRLDDEHRYLICVGALGDQRNPRIPSQYTIYNAAERTVRYKLLEEN